MTRKKRTRKQDCDNKDVARGAGQKAKQLREFCLSWGAEDSIDFLGGLSLDVQARVINEFFPNGQVKDINAKLRKFAKSLISYGELEDAEASSGKVNKLKGSAPWRQRKDDATSKKHLGKRLSATRAKALQESSEGKSSGSSHRGNREEEHNSGPREPSEPPPGHLQKTSRKKRKNAEDGMENDGHVSEDEQSFHEDAGLDEHVKQANKPEDADQKTDVAPWASILTKDEDTFSGEQDQPQEDQEKEEGEEHDDLDQRLDGDDENEEGSRATAAKEQLLRPEASSRSRSPPRKQRNENDASWIVTVSNVPSEYDREAMQELLESCKLRKDVPMKLGIGRAHDQNGLILQSIHLQYSTEKEAQRAAKALKAQPVAGLGDDVAYLKVSTMKHHTTGQDEKRNTLNSRAAQVVDSGPKRFPTMRDSSWWDSATAKDESWSSEKQSERLSSKVFSVWDSNTSKKSRQNQEPVQRVPQPPPPQPAQELPTLESKAGCVVKGTVQNFHDDRGFGFVVASGVFGPNLFFHRNEFLTAVLGLKAGDQIMFEVSWSVHREKWVATNLVCAAPDDAPPSEELQILPLAEVEWAYLSQLPEAMRSEVKDGLESSDQGDSEKHDNKNSDGAPADAESYSKKLCRLVNQCRSGIKNPQPGSLSKEEKVKLMDFVQELKLDDALAGWLTLLPCPVVNTLLTKFKPCSDDPLQVSNQLRAYCWTTLQNWVWSEMEGPSSNLQIANWPVDATEEYLRDMLSQYGDVEEISVAGNMPDSSGSASAKVVRALITSSSVRMGSAAQAKAALEDLDGKIPEGFTRPLLVRLAAPSESEPNERLYIKGLADDTTRDMLVDLLSPFGEASDIKILEKQTSSQSNAAIARMCSVEVARMAKTCLDGHTLEGAIEPLSVNFAKAKPSLRMMPMLPPMPPPSVQPGLDQPPPPQTRLQKDDEAYDPEQPPTGVTGNVPVPGLRSRVTGLLPVGAFPGNVPVPEASSTFAPPEPALPPQASKTGGTIYPSVYVSDLPDTHAEKQRIQNFSPEGFISVKFLQSKVSDGTCCCIIRYSDDVCAQRAISLIHGREVITAQGKQKHLAAKLAQPAAWMGKQNEAAWMVGKQQAQESVLHDDVGADRQRRALPKPASKPSAVPPPVPKPAPKPPAVPPPPSALLAAGEKRAQQAQENVDESGIFNASSAAGATYQAANVQNPLQLGTPLAPPAYPPPPPPPPVAAAGNPLGRVKPSSRKPSGSGAAAATSSKPPVPEPAGMPNPFPAVGPPAVPRPSATAHRKTGLSPAVSPAPGVAGASLPRPGGVASLRPTAKAGFVPPKPTARPPSPERPRPTLRLDP